MKRVTKSLLTVILSICCILMSIGPVSAHAEEIEDKFAAAFFPSGKVEGVPKGVYIQEKPENSYGSYSVVWAKNTDEFINIYLEYEDYDAKDQRDVFYDKYNLYDFDAYMIADMKVDNGQWISDFAVLNGKNYKTAAGESYGDGLPYYYLFVGEHRVKGDNMYDGTLLDCSARDSSEPEKDGFLAGMIADEKDGYKNVLDKKNHTYSFRFKFCVEYKNHDSKTDEYSEEKYIYGDWSDVISIGKNGNQKALNTPKTLTAPEVSEPVKQLDNGSWKGNIHYQLLFPESTTNEERAIIINENGFQPIYLQAEVEVNDSGNFEEIYTANPNSLTNGSRLTGINLDNYGGASKIKHICLRVQTECNQLSIKSEYAYAVPQVKGLKAKKTAAKSITLTWNKLDGVDFYEIYDGNGKFIGKTDKNTNTYVVKSLKAGNDYTFKVRAVDNEIFVGPFTSVTLPTKPSKANITKVASPSAKTITTTWKKVQGDGYQIQIATDSKFKKIVDDSTVKGKDTLTSTFSKAKSGTKYYVRVRTINSAGKSTVYSAWSKVKNIKCK